MKILLAFGIPALVQYFGLFIAAIAVWMRESKNPDGNKDFRSELSRLDGH